MGETLLPDVDDEVVLVYWYCVRGSCSFHSATTSADYMVIDLKVNATLTASEGGNETVISMYCGFGNTLHRRDLSL